MKKLSETFSIRIDVEVLKKIRKEAKEKDRSVNYIINKVLSEKYLNEK